MHGNLQIFLLLRRSQVALLGLLHGLVGGLVGAEANQLSICDSADQHIYIN